MQMFGWIRKWAFLILFLISSVLVPAEMMLTGCASRAVYVRVAPPPPKRQVRPPRPSARAVWIAGHWRWNGHRYVWVAGYWELRPKGRVWVPGHWKKTRHGFLWVPGHWRK